MWDAQQNGQDTWVGTTIRQRRTEVFRALLQYLGHFLAYRYNNHNTAIGEYATNVTHLLEASTQECFQYDNAILHVGTRIYLLIEYKEEWNQYGSLKPIDNGVGSDYGQ